jgi:hypothetical protein
MKFRLFVSLFIVQMLTWAGADAIAGSGSSPAWPHSIPARIEDTENRDLFIMTLGNVKTPLSQGTFDPVKDAVTMNDGKVISNYYRDVRGVKYYQPLDKSRFPLPPSGWCTWYYYYSDINAEEVKLNAKWLADNLKDYGARYVQIDDGWQGANRQVGIRDWTVVNRKFPDGMDGLAKYIKSLGLTPGLWLAPHGQSNPQVVSNHPNVFLRRADGSYDEGISPSRWEGRFLVDPSTPETLKYLEDLFTKLSGWGYEYFKVDGQPPVATEYRQKGAQMKNPSQDTDALYRKTLESIHKAIGPDRYLLGCWGTPIEGVGIYNGSRTGGDIVLGWGGFQVALRATFPYYYLHNIAWYGDPDVLLVRSPMTLDQARVWTALQGLTGQALMSTDRLADLSEERVELMKCVYPAVDIRPLDLFPAERNKRVWDLKVNHLGREYDVVGVFNFTEGRSEQHYLSWKELGLPADKPVHVFDFWNREYLGQWEAGMSVEVIPTSCRVFTLVPANGKIQLVSTSRHMTQGWVDLTELSQNGDSFKGTSKVVKDNAYELRFAFPRGTNCAVKSVTARGPSGKLPVKIFNHQGWAAVEMTSPRTGEVKWEVQFEPSKYYSYPVAAPLNLSVEPAGVDGVNLRWTEQYYLNVGYQVYLNGKIYGYSPKAGFALRGLDPRATNTVQVRSVWEDGRLSNNETNGRDSTKFCVENLLPAELALSGLQPLRSTAGWRGFEIEDLVAGNRATMGGKAYPQSILAAPNSEIEFDLKGLYQTFSAMVGTDDSATADRGIIFTVLGDGRELWKSDSLRKADGAKSTTVDIKGVQKLVLRTGAGAGGRRGGGGQRGADQANWGEAKVTKAAAPAKE